MATKFQRDTAVTAAGPGVWEGRIDRDWWIVRGPNGGYLAAVIVRALEETVADPGRQLRTLTVHYTAAPEPGPARIAVTIERAGRSLTTLSARMEQDGRLVAVALAASSAPRRGAVDFDDTSPPIVPPVDEVPSFERDPRLPPFASRWETRPALGDAPFRAGEEALAGGWIRPLEPQPIDAALVAQLADAWIPAVFARLQTPNPVPTIELTVHFRARLPLPAGWVLSRFESRLSRDGFVEEDGSLWTPDGTLIAQSRQLALLQAAT